MTRRRAGGSRSTAERTRPRSSLRSISANASLLARSEARISAAVADGGEQLYEGILRDIHSGGFIAGEAQRDRVNLRLVGFEQRTEPFTLSAPAGFEEFVLRAFQHHVRNAVSSMTD